MERVEIPAESQAKILETYKLMNTAWANFHAARETFLEVMRYTRTALIPNPKLGEYWDITPDATAFVSVESKPKLDETSIGVSSSDE